MIRLAWWLPPLRRFLWQLPPSPRRSRLLLAFFRLGYDEYNRCGTIPKTVFTKDVETYQAAEVLGTVGTFQGHEGLDQVMSELFDAFDEVRFDPRGMRDVGPDRWLVIVRLRGNGRLSGARVDKDITHVFTLRDGMRAERLEVYWDPDDALEAVGLSE